ncbi:MAG: hypothetical protein ACETWM_21685, partial [Candidatus Lokiarchaeia archaeon]
SVHYSSPALGDIDGDGLVEVVVGSLDRYVWAFDCPGVYKASLFPWPKFHHDMHNTALYPLPGPSILPYLFVYLWSELQPLISSLVLVAAGAEIAIVVISFLAGVLWQKRRFAK